MAADLDVSVNRAVPTVGKRKNVKKKKAFALPEGTIQLPTRSCPPALAQLMFLRGALSALFDVGEESSKGSLLKDKDIGQEYVCARKRAHTMTAGLEG